MQVNAPSASIAAANGSRPEQAPTSYQRWASSWSEASDRFQQAEQALTASPGPDVSIAVSKAREGRDLIRAGWVAENPELRLGTSQGNQAWELAGWVPDTVAKLERITGAASAPELATIVSELGAIQFEIKSVTDSRLSSI